MATMHRLRRDEARRRLDIIAVRQARSRDRQLHEPPLPDHVDPYVDQAPTTAPAPYEV